MDARVLPATCALASEQASPTAATSARLDRLLGYTAAHPNGRKIFRASDMVLRCYSDASYLSRPRAGSVAGGFHYLGDYPNDSPLNNPISFDTLHAHTGRLLLCSRGRVWWTLRYWSHRDKRAPDFGQHG